MDYVEELHNQANMRLVIAKLPYKMREKWRAWAFDTAEKKNQGEVCGQMMANGPIFGDQHVSTREGKERKIPFAARMTYKRKTLRKQLCH